MRHGFRARGKVINNGLAPDDVVEVALAGIARSASAASPLKNVRPGELAMREFADKAESVEVCRFRYVAFCLSRWDPVEKRLLAKVVELYVELDEAQADRFSALDGLQVGRSGRVRPGAGRAFRGLGHLES